MDICELKGILPRHFPPASSIPLDSRDPWVFSRSRTSGCRVSATAARPVTELQLQRKPYRPFASPHTRRRAGVPTCPPIWEPGSVPRVAGGLFTSHDCLAAPMPSPSIADTDSCSSRTAEGYFDDRPVIITIITKSEVSSGELQAISHPVRAGRRMMSASTARPAIKRITQPIST